ncbi:putative membrane bound O-acyl transferase family protein [Lyophyllum shimeji]|uniref:Membrane bound O-acyl transferase family protein n=1 Tax=Lyophyllum shimeji TaxID=47721 RepID=A0A9P3UKP9_LYOSH|nr:putative membrane bound O-acyl transferase family protein [Lyophyllum shimeji]
MAYLARRPDTYLFRLLLLPAALCGIVASAYRFVWTIPELNVYNWGQCLLAAVTIAKALEYAFHQEGMLKVGETRPGEAKGKAIANGQTTPTAQRGLTFIPSGLYDSVELMHTLRGLQWKFGQGVHIPKHTRPLERKAFLRATFLSFARNFILLDFWESVLKLFPGVGTPAGGTMFYPTLQPFCRYIVSTVIHMLTGSALLAGFGMVYDLITVIAVGCLDSSPASWPPAMDDPWSADSMHALWSKHWHQFLRQTFLVLGGYPGKWLAGDLGMLFGTFIASGLFHECAMYSMGRGFDHTVSSFFAMQGPILLLERFWRKLTRRRVGGWPGRLWVYFNLFILAQPMVDAWHKRGLGGGMVIPPFLSPVRLLLLPVVHKYLHTR